MYISYLFGSVTERERCKNQINNLIKENIDLKNKIAMDSRTTYHKEWRG